MLLIGIRELSLYSPNLLPCYHVRTSTLIDSHHRNHSNAAMGASNFDNRTALHAACAEGHLVRTKNSFTLRMRTMKLIVYMKFALFM